MKKTIRTIMIMMLVVLMLSSGVSAYAAPAKASATATELKWADFEDALKESKIEGDFYALNDVAVQFWVPSIFEQYDLEEEDVKDGLLAYFADDKDDYGFFVTYFDGEGMTLEEYAKEIEEDKDYSDLEYLTINGLDAIGFFEDDKERETEYEYVTFITESGYFLTFTYWDFADEDYQAVAAIMIASIQPEEDASK